MTNANISPTVKVGAIAVAAVAVCAALTFGGFIKPKSADAHETPAPAETHETTPLSGGQDMRQTSISDRVEAYSSESWTLVMAPNQSSQIALQGDGDTDLDLFIDDEYGARVCSGLSFSDRESCSVNGGPMGKTMTVTVRNLGGVYNRYQLQVN
ncbi:MAG: hypothetical protein GC189_00435 [Alphaproteobacteria bacterium]|nr:hypothetical protein [Alphaproteobacteria bacterium]